MINRNTLLTFMLLVCANTGNALELPFSEKGVLYVVGIDGCRVGEEIKTIPEVTTQYYLNKSHFYRIIVTPKNIEVTELEYPEVNWLNVGDTLWGETHNCSFSVGIEGEAPNISSVALERVASGKGHIHQSNGVYYWGK